MSPHRSAEDPDGAAMPPLPFCVFLQFVASGWRGWEPLALRARLWSGAALAASRAVPALGGCSLGPGWRSPVPGGCLCGDDDPSGSEPQQPAEEPLSLRLSPRFRRSRGAQCGLGAAGAPGSNNGPLSSCGRFPLCSQPLSAQEMPALTDRYEIKSTAAETQSPLC